MLQSIMTYVFFWTAQCFAPPIAAWSRWLGLLCISGHNLACKCTSELCEVERDRVHQVFLVRSGMVNWSSFSVKLVCSDRLHSLLKESNEHQFRRTRNINNTKARAKRNTTYACNDVSDWPLRISDSLNKDCWTLNITQSGLPVEQIWCCETRNLQWSRCNITDGHLDCISAMFTKITWKIKEKRQQKHKRKKQKHEDKISPKRPMKKTSTMRVNTKN